MSLSALSTTTAITPTTKPQAAVATVKGGGVTTFTGGTTSAGAYMAQGAGMDQPGGSLVKKLLIGGVLGAGAGFAASFLPIAWITNLGPGGWAAKGIMAAAGAAIGVAGAAITHFVGKRKATLNMEAQAAAQQQQSAAQAVAAPLASGGTLKVGSRGAAAKKLQTELKTIGHYDGKITGTYDAATATAVKKYEVTKGVTPMGLGSPEVRTAISQDASLVAQYAG
ncbi:MAG: hypothetical protein JWM90_1383 [Thermoleophilia bacterium]|nr:hypothetical protein [Thermoleophilia bacterium]